METFSYTTHESPIGTLLIAASNRGIRYLTMLEAETPEEHFARAFADGSAFSEQPGFFASATKAIDAYLSEGTPLKLPVDLATGTALQRMVWIELAKIPYGETISYSDLAERIGFPRAVRAVASACGANPVALVIPCHRVIAKDGTLGGYSMGGVHIKERLLAHEANHRDRQTAAAA